MKGNENIKKNDIYEIDLKPVDKMASVVISKGISFEHNIKPRQPQRTFPLPTKTYIGPKEHDLRGKRFGRLVVYGYLGKNKNCGSSAIWDVRCDCGNFEHRRTSALKRNKSVRKCQFCERLDILKEKEKYRELLEWEKD